MYSTFFRVSPTHSVVKLNTLPRDERLSHLPFVSLEDSLRPQRQEGLDSAQRSTGRCPAASRVTAVEYVTPPSRRLIRLAVRWSCRFDQGATGKRCPRRHLFLLDCISLERTLEAFKSGTAVWVLIPAVRHHRPVYVREKARMYWVILLIRSADGIGMPRKSK